MARKALWPLTEFRVRLHPLTTDCDPAQPPLDAGRPAGGDRYGKADAAHRRRAVAQALCAGGIRPGPSFETDEELAAADLGTTTYHPVGTCRTGHGSEAVVTDRLKVRGLENLRVTDASVMPAVTSGNTDSPTIMIAEKRARPWRWKTRGGREPGSGPERVEREGHGLEGREGHRFVVPRRAGRRPRAALERKGLQRPRRGIDEAEMAHTLPRIDRALLFEIEFPRRGGKHFAHPVRRQVM